jgi:hypothetical protein
MSMHRAALASAILLVVSTAATAQSGPPSRVHNRTLATVTDGGRQVFRLDARNGDGVAWWPDTTFTTSTIELDIRGRNVPQGSFVGVAFHGVDETTYEAIRVFVDRAATAALQVQRLTTRQGGWVGLWVGNTSPGDFANVAVTKQ